MIAACRWTNGPVAKSVIFGVRVIGHVAVVTFVKWTGWILAIAVTCWYVYIFTAHSVCVLDIKEYYSLNYCKTTHNPLLCWILIRRVRKQMCCDIWCWHGMYVFVPWSKYQHFQQVRVLILLLVRQAFDFCTRYHATFIWH